MLWIAWEDDTSIRSRVLARELRAEYRAFTLFSDSKALQWLRYSVAMVQTAWAIFRQRPDLVVAQNPSIVLAWEAALLRQLLGFRLVIDLHTHFIHPTGVSKVIYGVLNGYSLRNCSAVIVTNEGYKREVARHTTHPVLVLPDKVPDLDGQFERVPLRGRRSVLYVCTFSVDEPWREVIAAAAMLPEDTCIYMSGRCPIRQDQVPRNVILTGYLPREEYENLLRSVDSVMVLTTAEDNLVCGGYEAVAARKPLILSDTPALRDLFSRGAVFTENRSAAIARTIRNVHGDVPRLTTDIEALKEEMTVAWEERWRALLRALDLSDEPARRRTS